MKSVLLNYDFILKKFDNSPICIFYKDIKGNFLGSNLTFVTSLGFREPEDIIGKSDYELPFDKADSEKYRSDDAFVIQSKTPKMNIEEQQTLRNIQKKKKVLVNKVPIFNNKGGIAGVLGCYYDISSIEDQTKIYQLKILLNTLVMSIFHCPQNTNGITKSLEIDFFINTLFEFINFNCCGDGLEQMKGRARPKATSKEMQILTLLINGKTAREMGEILNRSPRTIEVHINNLKQKLEATTKSELIEKAIELGLAYIAVKGG